MEISEDVHYDISCSVSHQIPQLQQKKKPTVDLGHFPAVLRMICRAVRTTEQCYLVVELVSPDPEKLLQYLVILRNMLVLLFLCAFFKRRFVVLVGI